AVTPLSGTFAVSSDAVNGANICAMSTRYLSQYRAEACHASKALFCSSGFILVRRRLTPFSSFPRFSSPESQIYRSDPVLPTPRRRPPPGAGYEKVQKVRTDPFF